MMRNLWFVLIVVFLAIGVVCIGGCEEDVKDGAKTEVEKTDVDVVADPRKASPPPRARRPLRRAVGGVNGWRRGWRRRGPRRRQ